MTPNLRPIPAMLVAPPGQPQRYVAKVGPENINTHNYPARRPFFETMSENQSYDDELYYSGQDKTTPCWKFLLLLNTCIYGRVLIRRSSALRQIAANSSWKIARVTFHI